MIKDAHFCEYEYESDPSYPDTWPAYGCATYPVAITTEHAASSYGLPVVVIDGQARGPAEMPPGELQLPQDTPARMVERIQRAGYQVCWSPVDAGWLEAWEQAPEMGGYHWHPEARWVRF